MDWPGACCVRWEYVDVNKSCPSTPHLSQELPKFVLQPLNKKLLYHCGLVEAALAHLAVVVVVVEFGVGRWMQGGFQATTATLT
jgi:hypothetical protein